MNFQANLKSVLAFLGLVVTNAFADWMADGAVWPTSLSEGLRWALTIVGGTLLVRQTPNFYTVPQLQQKLTVAKERVDNGKQPT